MPVVCGSAMRFKELQVTKERKKSEKETAEHSSA